ncbi:MAG TPA: YcnI family protein, partial [Jatrophihabitans sp.]|nr:YcnI family protein [Jatrophihabitans sp.]
MTILRRGGALTIMTASMLIALVVAAVSASAHVTVSSPDAVAGGYAVVTFQVPSESDTASTTELKLQLPLDQPLASVAVKPVPGWSFTVTKTKLPSPITTDDGPVSEAISVIDWKADSAASGIKPGEFQQFVISAGPLPKASSMTFKVIQTYSDKSVVSWIEQPAPGSSAEPAHPAPTLKLAASTTASPAAAASTTAAADAGSSGSSATATAALVLGVIAILLGGLALALTVL